jgi:hypothetical protein
MRVKEQKIVRMDKLTLAVEGVWQTTWKDGVERGEETRVRAIVKWAGEKAWSVSCVMDDGVLSPYAGSELAKEYGSAIADRHARQFLRWLGLCFKDEASSLFNSLDSAYLFNPEYRQKPGAVDTCWRLARVGVVASTLAIVFNQLRVAVSKSFVFDIENYRKYAPLGIYEIIGECLISFANAGGKELDLAAAFVERAEKRLKDLKEVSADGVGGEIGAL